MSDYPRMIASGSIVLMDGDETVSDAQPCEVWVEGQHGELVDVSVRHEPLTVTAPAVRPVAWLTDESGTLLYTTPTDMPLPPVTPGETVTHSPLGEK